MEEDICWEGVAAANITVLANATCQDFRQYQPECWPRIGNQNLEILNLERTKMTHPVGSLSMAKTAGTTVAAADDVLLVVSTDSAVPSRNMTTTATVPKKCKMQY